MKTDKTEQEKKKSRQDLNYEEEEKTLIEFLESKENTTMVLATSHDDRVLARNVLIANNGLDIYSFTWGHSRKAVQIQKNPRVALCKDTVQIEGVAEIVGGLTDEKSRKYTEIIRKKFPEPVAWWEKFPGMVIVRIRPTSVVIGGSGDDPHLKFLDLETRTAYAEGWAYY